MSITKNWAATRVLQILTGVSLLLSLVACGGGEGRAPILGAGSLASNGSGSGTSGSGTSGSGTSGSGTSGSGTSGSGSSGSGGSSSSVPPTVTAVAPSSGEVAVATNATVIDARFSEPISPITSSSSFTVTCAAPCISPSGTISLDSTGTLATYTLASGTALASLTQYTATITGVTGQGNGMALAAPFVWTFTTAASADSTLPRVSSTVPSSSSPSTNVPANTLISAVFTEEMAPATINASTFEVTCSAPCTAPAGSVSYVAGSQTAIFTPTAALPSNTTFTVTITTGATDLAGNPLAGNQGSATSPSNYVWSFTTSAAAPTNILSIQTTFPANGATGVCPSAALSATVTVPAGLRLNPATITATTFTLKTAGTPSTPVVAASVSLDASTGKIVTFTPLTPLVPGIAYIATIKGGANGIQDLASPADTLPNDVSWTFTPGASGACLLPVMLNSAAPFGTFGGSSGMTNMGVLTVINGDIGTTAVSTAVTGFHDATPGCTYSQTLLNIGQVNGNIDTAPPPPTVACPNEGTALTLAIATQAAADALVAYNQLAAMPPGPDPGAGSLANLVLAPGVYTAAAGSFKIQGGNLTLDAGGNPNAVWVFQMATSLTVGGPGAAFPQSIVLINGAQAQNVFWQVGTAATINAAGGGTMVGTIITQAGASFSTAGNVTVVTLNGRAISLNASVTLVNTVINVPR